MITLNSTVEDIDIIILALYRFAGAERFHDDDNAVQAGVIAKELGKSLNKIDPEGSRPIANPDRKSTVHVQRNDSRIGAHKAKVSSDDD